MLWSLGNEGTIPRIFAATNAHGTPVLAVIFSMLGGILSLLSSVYAAGTIYLVLVSISGLAVVIVWMAIAICQLNRRRFLAAGHSVDELKYRTPWYPVVPGSPFSQPGLLPTNLVRPFPTGRLYWTVPFVALCYGGYYLARFLSNERRCQHHPKIVTKSLLTFD